jgi:hypothetical protein
MHLRPVTSAAARRVAVGLLLVTGLVGCGPDTHAAARASAACGSALHDELGLSENETGPQTRTEVTGDDAGRHVEGTWTSATAGEGSFTCDVVPDADDELRGLRVSRIDVQRTG